MKTKNYYEILELQSNASAEDIKRAYRRLARRYHPDSADDNASVRQFNEIREAYEVLSDPEARRRHDRREDLLSGHREHWEKSRPRSDASDRQASPEIRSQVKLSRNSASSDAPAFRVARKVRVEDQVCESSKVSLLDRLKGGVRLAFDRSNQEPARQIVRSLRGDRVYRFTIDALESLQGATREVALQHGDATRTVKVHIPAGVHGGDTFTVSCPETESFPAETIKVAVSIEPHPLLEREGLDLTVKLPITLGEAIKGVELQVPTINGSVKVKVPPGWQETKRLRLKSRGLRHPSGNYQGDLYVKVYVVAPPAESSMALQLAEAIDQLYTRDVRQDIPLSLGGAKA